MRVRSLSLLSVPCLLLAWIPAIAQGAGTNVLTKGALEADGQSISPAGTFDLDSGKVKIKRGTCPPSGASCNQWNEVGQFFICTDPANRGTVYVCSDASGWLSISDSGSFLPVSGGMMTGTITGENSDPSLVIPTWPDPNTRAPAIRFDTQGMEPVPWRVWVGGATPPGFGGDHDHGFMHTYNLHWTATNGLEKDDPYSHAIRMAFESRFTVDDPNTHRGTFEFNLDIDPNLNPEWTSNPWRPFFLGAAMDSPRNTVFTIGDPANSGNPTQEMSLTMNYGGKCGFCYYQPDLENHGDTVEFGALRLMGSDRASITTQGRIVLDPGGTADYSGDYAPKIGNIVGSLRLEPGKDPNGTAMEIFLGEVLAPNVRVGPAYDVSRFSIKGARDQTQFSLIGHSTQNQTLVYVGTNSRHLFDIKPFGVVAIGDDAWGGLLSLDGYQDTTQLYVRGFSTQSKPIALFEKDDGTDILDVRNTNTIRLNPIATAPATCEQGEIYMDTSGAFCVCTSANAWTNTTGVGTCA